MAEKNKGVKRTTPKAIGEAMKRFPGAKEITIPMLHEDEVQKYIKGEDELHDRAKNSKLRFGEARPLTAS